MSNPLSQLGRLSYGAHLLVYPAVGIFYLAAVKPLLAKKKITDEEHTWAIMPKLREVDPDLFSPFTPIPYHNNKELKYSNAHIKMAGYINKNHINVKDYPWRSYHDSFDHSNKKVYTYDWSSMHSNTH